MTGGLQKPNDSVHLERLPLTYHPMKGASLLQRDLKDGCVLHDRKTGIVYTLNNSASFILTFCTGDYSIEDIALETAEVFGLQQDSALRDVVSVMEMMQDQGLLDTGRCGDRHGQNLL